VSLAHLGFHLNENGRDYSDYLRVFADAKQWDWSPDETRDDHAREPHQDPLQFRLADGSQCASRLRRRESDLRMPRLRLYRHGLRGGVVGRVRIVFDRDLCSELESSRLRGPVDDDLAVC